MSNDTAENHIIDRYIIILFAATTLKHKNTTFTSKKGVIYPKALALPAFAKTTLLVILLFTMLLVHFLCYLLSLAWEQGEQNHFIELFSRFVMMLSKSLGVMAT